ncbi:hypothetical protein CAEBREN_10031 [Caenorhabditis brenneri]|uniref:Uncharacterized protein n=1 Tax=Caenorhabditis brenneri TaxID=135651 RepID=G0PBF6_CAEBE|nr:hypothetical protein CAEBREN_10031 [Caenorhabditis brenneri]
MFNPLAKKRFIVKATYAPNRAPIPENLPILTPVEMAVELGLLPEIETYIEEVFTRAPYLENDQTREWLRKHVDAIMPRSVAKQQGSGICGSCSSNWFGMPMRAHNQKDCGIPFYYRAQFQAVNTRAMCPKCKGRSDNHNVCYAKDVVCGQCQQNQLGARPHQPSTGICFIAPGSERAQFETWRIKQYNNNVRRSLERPFRVRLYNDEPLKRAIPVGFGLTPYVDHNNRIGRIQYTDDATYPGIMSTHGNEERRKEMEQRIQREINKRSEDAALKQFQDLANAIAQEANQIGSIPLSKSSKSPSKDQGEGKGLQVRDRSHVESGDEIGQKSDSGAKQTSPPLIDQETQEFINVHRLTTTSAEAIQQAEGSQDVTIDGKRKIFWINENIEKMKALINTGEDYKKRLQKVAGKPEAIGILQRKNKVDARPRPINHDNLNEGIWQLANTNNWQSPEILTWMQELLTGDKEENAVFEDDQWKTINGEPNWREEYAEYLLKMMFIMPVAETTISTKLSSNSPFVRLSQFESPYLIADTASFMQIDPSRRSAYFFTLALNIAQDLLKD